MLQSLRRSKTWAIAVSPPPTESGKTQGPRKKAHTNFYENQTPKKNELPPGMELTLDLVTDHPGSKEHVKGPCWVLVPNI